jgi:hypothetical protein
LAGARGTPPVANAGYDRGMATRRFPPPLTIDEMNDVCFIVRDKNGQQLGYPKNCLAVKGWPY